MAKSPSPSSRPEAPSENLSGRVALITGGGAGIGKAAAKLLASEGVKVAVLGRTEDEVKETCEEITADGGTCLTLVADISEVEPLERAFAQIEQSWKRLDIVFANAGINGVWTGIEDLKVEEWDKTLAVNLRGTFLTVKFAVPLLKKMGGSIIITSSVNGTRMFSNTGATAYATSKAGQVAFGRMCALELAAHHIRVNTICPGAITTQIDQSTEKRNVDDLRVPALFPKGEVPLTEGQPGRAEQVAELVRFLASNASSHITGTEIFIDGAESLLRG